MLQGVQDEKIHYRRYPRLGVNIFNSSGSDPLARGKDHFKRFNHGRIEGASRVPGRATGPPGPHYRKNLAG